MWDCDEIDFNEIDDGTDPLTFTDRLEIARYQYRDGVVDPKATYREQVRQWLYSKQIKYQLGVTLTFHRRRLCVDRKGYFYKRALTREDCVQTFEFFAKRLNSKLLGNEAKRRRSSLYILPALEFGKFHGDPHVHLAIAGIRDFNSLAQIRSHALTIHSLCKKLDWVSKAFVDFEPNRSLAKYVTKDIKGRDDQVLLWDRTPDNMLRFVGGAELTKQ